MCVTDMQCMTHIWSIQSVELWHAYTPKSHQYNQDCKYIPVPTSFLCPFSFLLLCHPSLPLSLLPWIQALTCLLPITIDCFEFSRILNKLNHTLCTLFFSSFFPSFLLMISVYVRIYHKMGQFIIHLSIDRHLSCSRFGL